MRNPSYHYHNRSRDNRSSFPTPLPPTKPLPLYRKPPATRSSSTALLTTRSHHPHHTPLPPSAPPATSTPPPKSHHQPPLLPSANSHPKRELQPGWNTCVPFSPAKADPLRPRAAEAVRPAQYWRSRQAGGQRWCNGDNDEAMRDDRINKRCTDCEAAAIKWPQKDEGEGPKHPLGLIKRPQGRHGIRIGFFEGISEVDFMVALQKLRQMEKKAGGIAAGV